MISPSSPSRPWFWLAIVADVVLASLFFTLPAAGELEAHEPVDVRILVDNSGSMYPGYLPKGYPGRRSLAESGGKYYLQHPEMQRWLEDFARAQTIFNAHGITVLASTSHGSYSSSDVRTVLRGTDPKEFSFAKIRRRIPSEKGSHTYLTESVRAASRSFEGILWLVTDNIVENRRNVPDQGVREFFQVLSEEPRYQAVHLYKLPFDRLVPGADGTLAIYGILVSSSPIDKQDLLFFDGRFRGEFLRARGRQTGQRLFADRSYWKLKDMTVGALELSGARLEVSVAQEDRGLFREKQTVELKLEARIRSNLTQHQLVEGSVRIVPKGPFVPSTADGEDYGLEKVPGELFEGPRLGLPPILPRDSVELDAKLVSRRPVPLETEGFGAWLRSASGLQVTYSGEVEAQFEDLVAEFDASEMAGIFGAEVAPDIFGITERVSIEKEISNSERVSFRLTSSYGRQLLLLLLTLLLLTLAGLLAWFFGRSLLYTVEIRGGGKEPRRELVPLRRFGSRRIVHSGHELGVLRRGPFDAGFVPNSKSAAVQVKRGGSRGAFDIELRDLPAAQLSISDPSGRGVPMTESMTRPTQPQSSPGHRISATGNRRPATGRTPRQPTGSPGTSGGSPSGRSGGEAGKSGSRSRNAPRRRIRPPRK